jgi:hypothetical protein
MLVVHPISRGSRVVFRIHAASGYLKLQHSEHQHSNTDYSHVLTSASKSAATILEVSRIRGTLAPIRPIERGSCSKATKQSMTVTIPARVMTERTRIWLWLAFCVLVV